MKILEKKEDPLLARKMIIAEIDYAKKATPSKEEVKKKITEILKTKNELVALKHIYPIYGVEKAKVIAHVYKNIKDLKAVEEIKKKPKKAKKKKVEKPAEEKPAEKKKEKVKKPGEAEHGKEGSKK